MAPLPWTHTPEGSVPPPQGSPVHRRRLLGGLGLWTLLLWTLLGAVLRFWNLGLKPPWADEWSTLLFSLGQGYQGIPVDTLMDLDTLLQPLRYPGLWTPGSVVARLLAESNHPPLYFLLTQQWLHLWPASDGWVSLVGGRALSALLGVVAIPLSFGVAHSLGRSSPHRLTLAHLSAALMAVSPFGVYLAQEARHYTLSVIWILLLLWFVGRGVRSIQTHVPLSLSQILAWIVLNGLGLATHFFYGLALAAAAVALGRVWWMSRSQARSRSWQRLYGVAAATGITASIGLKLWQGLATRLPSTPSDSGLTQWLARSSWTEASGLGQQVLWVLEPVGRLLAWLITMVMGAPLEADLPWGWQGGAIALMLLGITYLAFTLGFARSHPDRGSQVATLPQSPAIRSAAPESLDAGPLDSGSLDSGSLDAGSLDSGSLDAGSLDSGPLDAGSLDAGPLDSGPLDSGSLNSGPLDPKFVAPRFLNPQGLVPGSLPAFTVPAFTVPSLLISQILASASLFLLLVYGGGLDLTLAPRYQFVVLPAVLLAVAWGLAPGWDRGGAGLLKGSLKLQGQRWGVVLILALGLLGSGSVVHNGLYQKTEQADVMVQRLIQAWQGDWPGDWGQAPVAMVFLHHTTGETGQLLSLGWQLHQAYDAVPRLDSSPLPPQPPQFFLAHWDHDREEGTQALHRFLAQAPRPLSLWVLNFSAARQDVEPLGCHYSTEDHPEAPGYWSRLYHCTDRPPVAP
ncbi:glycosyltransferase family 39 protein [Prochlorothrix hollandica]|uniref:glycosyltransferase family 39 protein n=1 Tax=Prochlorothrix hollandica TaxID=1223 RepID=UPI00333E3036